MDRTEYRKWNTERSVRLYGAAGGFLAGADLGMYDKLNLSAPLADMAQDAAIGDLPWSGSATAIAAAACCVAYPTFTRGRRKRPSYRMRQNLKAREWAGKQDRQEFLGVAACRKDAEETRPDLSKKARGKAEAAEVGVPLGTMISGSRTLRQRLLGTVVRSSHPLRQRLRLGGGHELAVPFSTAGMLVLGEPGSRKSTFLAGIASTAPGACVIVSTKAEFMRGWRARAAKGPVVAFAPLASSAEIPAGVSPLSWSLVRGCRNVALAQERAQQLMEATANSGLENAGFWDSMSKAVITAMLVAADLRNANLRDVGSWIQLHEYDVPIKVLQVAREAGYPVEDSLIDGLEGLADPDNKTASSASLTAGNVLRFLQSGALADSLSPGSATARRKEDPREITTDSITEPGTLHEDETDLHELVRRNGTLYIVTDQHDAMPPVVNAVWGAVVAAAKSVAQADDTSGQQQPRLSRPLTLIADEVSSTMRSVPLDEHAATLRGHGMYIIAATQNRAKLQEVWGETRARALAGSLQTHVILSLADVNDRKHYSERLGKRVVDVVKTSRSAPADRRTRMGMNVSRRGYTSNITPDREERDLWPHEAWSHLRPGEAVVIPTRGAPAVVRFGNGWKVAEGIGKQTTPEQKGAQEWGEDADGLLRAAAERADEWSEQQRQRQANGETPQREWWQ